MERKNRVIIIGAGLGGLECGYILAKNGCDVTVLEHDAHIGGCLQTFKRGKALFDTGFHYVGGLDEGQSLHGLFRYFGLLDLPWQRMDADCFDEVVIGGKSYPFANGHQNFVARLAESFPKEKANLTKYAEFLRQVGEHLPDSFSAGDAALQSTSLFAKSAYQFLNDTISDPLLRKVLSGTSLKMELCAETLPLYVFAQINNSFIQSAWRLRGGGSLIADRLAESIRAFGGTVRTNSTVTKIVCDESGKISKVMVNGGESVAADWVISSAHPAVTIGLFDEDAPLRHVYRRRISNLHNSFGMFTANIRLKPNELPYLNRNIFVHRPDADLWHVDTQRTDSVLVNYGVPEDGSDYAATVDLLTPMRWSDVERWAECARGHRGESYVDFKNRKVEECLQLVERRLPQLRTAVERVFTSTPLSYRAYTLTSEGSAYGISKDYNNPLGTVLAPRTPVENLLLTGQSLNLHGVLGVSMTSVFTCAEILGMDFLSEQLDVKHWHD